MLLKGVNKGVHLIFSYSVEGHRFNNFDRHQKRLGWHTQRWPSISVIATWQGIYIYIYIYIYDVYILKTQWTLLNITALRNIGHLLKQHLVVKDVSVSNTNVDIIRDQNMNIARSKIKPSCVWITLYLHIIQLLYFFLNFTFGYFSVILGFRFPMLCFHL